MFKFQAEKAERLEKMRENRLEEKKDQYITQVVNKLKEIIFFFTP